MAEPSVSVIIPTYNSVGMLECALDALEQQTMPADEIEVLVYDDGSTDGTLEYLNKRAETFPGLQVFHQPNSGSPSLGRNRGIQHACGRYLFFHDADDWLGRKALARMVRTADATGADVVVGRTRKVGNSVDRISRLRPSLDADLIRDRVWRSLAPQKLFRSALISRLGVTFPEDQVQGEDQVFVAQCLFGAKRVCTLTGYDYYFRRLRDDAGNLSKTRQTLENKVLTTTRMAAIISANVEADQRPYYFKRVILKTLASGLGPPLTRAGRDERQRGLDKIKAEVLPYLSPELLSWATDHQRLRLLVAKNGDARDLIRLNRILARGVPVSIEHGRAMLDAGAQLNPLIGDELREVRNPIHREFTATAITVGPGVVKVVIDAGTGRGQPRIDSVRLSAHRRRSRERREFRTAPRGSLFEARIGPGRLKSIWKDDPVWNLTCEGKRDAATVSQGPLRWGVEDAAVLPRRRVAIATVSRTRGGNVKIIIAAKRRARLRRISVLIRRQRKRIRVFMAPRNRSSHGA